MSPEARDRAAAFVALVATVLAFHLASRGVVRWYYAARLPHYDSVGSYTHVARVQSLARRGELAGAWGLAVNYHLSWLQSAFALATAWWLPPGPPGAQLYNSLAAAWAVYALYRAARDLGAGRRAACLAGALVFVPDALACWDGGLVDLRRDGAFFALLLAGTLLTFSYLWRPTAARGLLAGLACALATWSRGNAWPFVALHCGPALLVGAAAHLRRGGRGRTLALGGLAFALLAGANLASTARATAARYQNPAVSYALGGDPWRSLREYGPTVWRLWANREPGPNSTRAVFALAAGLTALWLLAALRLSGRARPARPSGRAAALAAGGAWAAASTLGLLCFVARADARYGFAGAHPFYPVLAAPVTLLLALAIPPGAAGAGRRPGWAWVLPLVLAFPLALSLRAWCRARPAEPEAVRAAAGLYGRLRRDCPGAVVAFLSHDRVNYDTLAYLEAHGGYGAAGRLAKMRWLLPAVAGATQLDTACRFSDGGDPGGVTAALLEQIHGRADYVVVHGELAHYQLPPGRVPFLFHQGAPLVQALCGDEAYALVGHYALAGGGRPGRGFLVLRNTRLDRGGRGR